MSPIVGVIILAGWLGALLVSNRLWYLEGLKLGERRAIFKAKKETFLAGFDAGLREGKAGATDHEHGEGQNECLICDARAAGKCLWLPVKGLTSYDTDCGHTAGAVVEHCTWCKRPVMVGPEGLR